MSKFGAIESQALVVPVGGWAANVDDGHGTLPIVVPAGSYSPTTLLSAFIALINAASVETYSAVIANGEGGSGSCTITSSVNIEINWTSTDLRDALGFVADVAAASPLTSDYGLKGLFLPDCPMAAQYRRGDSGHTEGGPVQTRSPLGAIKTIVHPTRVRNTIHWSHVSAARARQEAESGVPRSWERFYRETMMGAVSYFTPGGQVRVVWDADVPGTYTTYWPVARTQGTALERVDAQWAGLYAIDFEGFVA